MPSWDAPRSAASTLLLTRLGAEHGLAAADALAGTGLTLSMLRTPGAEVTGAQELTLVRNLHRADLPVDRLALEAGTRYHVTTYGIWGFALASSRTVRDALEIGMRFVDLSFTFCALRIETADNELRMVLDDAAVPADLRAFVVVRDLAALRTLSTELVPGLTLRALSMQRSWPADLQPYLDVFGVQPEFGAQANVAVLDAALLDLPLPQADEHTAAVTAEQCRRLLARRRARVGTAGKVRDLLVHRPGQMPDVAEVARLLAVSERTLRRRLAEEGMSFRGLVDEVREALAEELLRAGGLSVEQVARRLGYAETASFTHAFTRWKGMSPRAFLQAPPSGRRAAGHWTPGP